MNKKDLEQAAYSYSKINPHDEGEIRAYRQGLLEGFIDGANHGTPRWRKCSEEMPEMAGRYFLRSRHKETGATSLCFANYTQWGWRNCLSDNYDIVDWLPLSELDLPEEE